MLLLFFCSAFFAQGFKWLRLYDVRSAVVGGGAGSSQPLSAIAHAKGVQAVVVDPFVGHRLATASEDGIIKLWDVRMLNEATVVLETKKSLLQLSWCPTRPSLLVTYVTLFLFYIEVFWYTTVVVYLPCFEITCFGGSGGTGQK